jgi:hypothetical protein
MSKRFSSADRVLAQRIEAADAAAVSAMAHKLAEARPNLGAAEPACGGYAIFGGVGSPMTHAMGIGMSGPRSSIGWKRSSAAVEARR